MERTSPENESLPPIASPPVGHEDAYSLEDSVQPVRPSCSYQSTVGFGDTPTTTSNSSSEPTSIFLDSNLCEDVSDDEEKAPQRLSQQTQTVEHRASCALSKDVCIQISLYEEECSSEEKSCDTSSQLISSTCNGLKSCALEEAKECVMTDSEGDWGDDLSDCVSYDTPVGTPLRKRKLDGSREQMELVSAKKFMGGSDSQADELEVPQPRKRFPSRPPPPAGLPAWLDIFQNWSSGEQLEALEQLIDVCELPQVRYMMQLIEPQFQRDFISLLPKELALYVLSFLDPADLVRAAQTCRYWRILADDNLLWREKCKEAGITDLKDILNKRRLKGNSAPLSGPWKAAFMRQNNIELNWRSRPIRPPTMLKGHDDHVITCLQFSGNRIVSGSDDNTLKVWSANTGKCLRTLVGHTGGVWSSQMSGNIIVSGSTDRTLKVWNADTGACEHTLYGHTSTVRCMHLYNNKVVSGSRDATLRVWDLETGECRHVLVGHVAAVRCVQYNGRLVVSGAYDYMVKVWLAEREECLHTLQGHTNRVYSLQFDGIHVVSGSLDTSIRVWDVESGSLKHTLVGHQSLTSGMELKDNILVSGNADSTVKVWDITTGQCLQTLSGPNKHHSAVTCLQLNNKFVITSSDDGTVKLWDVRTGEFLRNLVTLESGGSGGVVWRIRANATKLVCAVGSRNGTEETKLLVLDFDVEK